MNTQMLPNQFASLESFAPKWCVGDANERYNVRLATDMEELRTFYDAAVARGEEAMQYLASVSMDDIDDQQTNLMWMYCSLSAVSFAIDVFRQPTVPETCGARMDFTTTPYP
jgi:hypothetical protein